MPLLAVPPTLFGTEQARNWFSLSFQLTTQSKAVLAFDSQPTRVLLNIEYRRFRHQLRHFSERNERIDIAHWLSLVTHTSFNGVLSSAHFTLHLTKPSIDLGLDTVTFCVIHFPLTG